MFSFECKSTNVVVESTVNVNAKTKKNVGRGSGGGQRRKKQKDIGILYLLLEILSYAEAVV